MTRTFPQNFDLRLFSGPRAKQFKKPEDAFQQLIGDALKEMAGSNAHITQTLGADGSIDSYLAEGAGLSGPVTDLTLPAVIECKAHDDQAKNLRKNIFDQWGKVRKKLEAAALTGWQDLFEPWSHARGYAYCISANIPNEKTRSDLDSAIRKFFFELSATAQTAVETIRIIDWNDLRQWLGTLPTVSDEWLGIDFDLILTHATYLQHLSGFREYLLPSKLEFVPPTENSPFHPARVLAEIAKDNGRDGVLLVGAGGVGKTRTALEVGTLATLSDWRVLHVLPDEPGVETEEIAEIVLGSRDSRALLVFDYVDQMQRLDLGSIRRSLIPAARERGIRLRLLANTRPGWMELQNPERDELFQVIELRPSESHKAKLIKTMASRIAPTACHMLGYDEVIRLCGSRAIVALLIAREMETRALSGLLQGISFDDLRSGDLVQWLQRRLHENNLSVKQELGSLTPSRPDPPMVAAAAALACAPDTPEMLRVAANSAYRNLMWPNPNEDARYLVDLLVKLGWLESHGIFISTAHDVVADEVLEQTIHREAIVFERESTAVLSCALNMPRGLGRLAIALRRVLGSVTSEDVVRSLTEFLRRWLTSNAAGLGEVLKSGNPDLTGYALGAVLSGPPWEEAAEGQWDKLFLPWLNEHSIKEEARHLLYKGLRSVHVDRSALVTPALTWLDSHSPAAQASFVIRPLLERSDLSEAEAKKTRDFALSWLQQHLGTLNAQFVLNSLLERNDLSEAEAKNTKDFALSWLQQYLSTLNARFVLKSLLERCELSEAEAKHTKDFALSWLQQHISVLNAGFVLKPLLEQSGLSEAEAKNTKDFALSWLQQHLSTLAARFVLKPLLEQSGLSEAEAKHTKDFALSWLQQHLSTLEAGFVLKPLLERSDLSKAEAKRAQDFALSWLQQYLSTLDAGFLLKPLLERSELSEAEAKKIKDFALSWLQQHLGTLNAQFVLNSLLVRSDLLEAEAEKAKDFALSWLQQYLSSPEARFVLKPLLERSDLSKAEAEKTKDSALSWARQHLSTLEAGFLLKPLLEQSGLSEAEAKKIKNFALSWLQQHLPTLAARFVLKPLLEQSGLSEAEAKNTKDFALSWLQQHLSTLDAGFVLKPLLERSNLSKAEAEKTKDFALSWLQQHLSTLEAGFVLPGLLQQKEATVGEAMFLVESAATWLQVFYDTMDAEFVLRKLFRRGDIPLGFQSSLLQSAIQRLGKRLEDDEASFLLRSCLQYRVENEFLSQQLVSLAIQWLGLHPASPSGDYVWNRVLRYPPNLVSDSDWLKVANYALLWLKRRRVTDQGFDQTTNSLLMRQRLLGPEERQYIVRLAIELLDTHLHPAGRRRLVASLQGMLSLFADGDPLKNQLVTTLDSHNGSDPHRSEDPHRS